MRRRPYEGPEARPHMRNDLSFQTMMSTQVRPANALELLGRSASAGLTLQFTMSLRRRLAIPDRNGWDGTSLFFRDRCEMLVEPHGIEPTTSCLQSTRSTN